MLCKRIVAKLDIKGPNLVKGIHLEGLRIMGDPYLFAKKYEEQGADEIIYIDTVASLYGRNNLIDIVKKTTQNIFIPITVGGGIRTIEHINELLKSGADKVAINTAAINNPSLITKAAEIFGRQCVIVSIEAKKKDDKQWEAYTENGRQPSGKDVIEWIKEAIEYGAGEILLTSIDKDGTKKGFDMELVEAASKVCTVPLIISGGADNIHGIKNVFNKKADAVAMASILHYNLITIKEIKENLKEYFDIRYD